MVIAELKAFFAKYRARRRLLADRRFVERGVREGWLTPARNRTPGPPPSIPVAPLETILRALDEDRADR